MNHKSSREGLSSYERICGEFVRLNKKLWMTENPYTWFSKMKLKSLKRDSNKYMKKHWAVE